MIKQSDIALIILVISISLFASWFLANTFINTEENRSEEVEVIRPISADFNVPPENVFNDDAINPTERIDISGNDTKKPFKNNEQSR